MTWECLYVKSLYKKPRSFGFLFVFSQRLKGSLIAFRSTSQSTFSTQSLTHSGNGRRSEKILQKGTNRRWHVTLQRTLIAAGLTVTLTLLSCLVVGQNNVVMSLKLCTFVVLRQAWTDHLFSSAVAFFTATALIPLICHYFVKSFSDSNCKFQFFKCQPYFKLPPLIFQKCYQLFW